MSHSSPFKTPQGEARFVAAYDAAMKLWPVPYDEIEIRSRFGTTHVVASGPKNAPPLVLLHGYMATLTMWSPNIAALSRAHRVYALDVMGQPSKSHPTEPIRSAADFVSWLTATLDALHLDRVALVGMSFGGWLALNYAVAVPERVRQLVLLSPGGLLPMVRQFTMRGMLMVWLPTRLTVNSFFRWLGFTNRAYAPMLDLVYLGLKHFRMPVETARVLPAVVSDEQLRTMKVPTLVLIGDQEVISDPSRALERARRLIPDAEGELVPGCRHDMCSSRHHLVDARVLDFLKTRSRQADTQQRNAPSPRAEENPLLSPFPAILTLALLYWFPVRRWFGQWGATPDELRRVMAGDGVIANPTHSATHAVTVDAPPEDIWPWLVQMGYQRGGLYSIDWLDRLFGFLDRPSADRVLPEFQHLAVGDTIRLGPRETLTVTALDPCRTLVLNYSAHDFEWVWQFALYAIDEHRTRLVSRGTERYANTVGAWVFMRVMEPAAFIMTRRMLLGLKRRAEALRAARVHDDRRNQRTAA